MPIRALLLFLLFVTPSFAAAQTLATNQPRTAKTHSEAANTSAAQTKTKVVKADSQLLYTTYFYTAGEAIIHGYEDGTKVRLVSMDQGKTVYTGVVGRGETKNIPTGRGVFGFMSDQKASILVGTPSSCTAVGYWLRDQNGSFRANHFYTELPSSVSHNDARVLVWAWEDTTININNLTTESKVTKAFSMKAGTYMELTQEQLSKMSSNVLEFNSTSKAISVQVYYDQGFFVPSLDGRLAGKIFNTYVGVITSGPNDLNLFNQGRTTQTKVTDLKTGEVIWKGKLKKGAIKSLRLGKKYVRVESKDEISVSVAPNNYPGYAEHHFAAGIEGTGIETDFLNTTSQELWVFSYFEGTEVTVSDVVSGKQVWKGTLGAGDAHGVHPGSGQFRVQSSNGVSVMGGSATCGAEYSPAGGMFRIDEELLAAAKVIIAERKRQAQAAGRDFTDEDAAAPLTEKENKRLQDHVKRSLNKSMNASEVQQRYDSMQVK